MVLPLRVWLDDRGNEAAPMQWAHTIDISPIGCRLGGLRTELAPGQTVILQRGQHKATFRVIWCKHLAENENHAGIEALDYDRDIWGVELPPSGIAKELGKDTSFDSPAPVKSVSSAFIPKQQSRSAARKFVPSRLRLGRRWSLGLGFIFLFVLGLVWALSPSLELSRRVEIQPPIPGQPTAELLARLTPKPHRMPVSLAERLPTSGVRLQVAEAPTAHVVYPVAPDNTTSGTVRLQVIIAANGLVKHIHLLSGNQTLAQAAAEAVSLWHYGSFKGSDRTTERETSVTVSFRGADAVVLEFPSSKTKILAD
jgi:hypothetical protein